MTDPVRRTETPKNRAPSRRARMRAAGLKPLLVWVPDTKDPEFAEKLRQQAKALADHDPGGDEIMAEIEAGYEWPEWKE